MEEEENCTLKASLNFFFRLRFQPALRIHFSGAISALSRTVMVLLIVRNPSPYTVQHCVRPDLTVTADSSVDIAPP